MPKTAWEALVFAMRPYRKFFWPMWFFVILGNVLAFSVPYFFKLIADYAIETPVETFEPSELTFPIIGAIIFLVAHEIAYRIGHIIEIYFVTRSFNHITTHIYHTILERPTSYFEDQLSGKLGRRIEQIGSGVTYFFEDFPWEIGWAVIAIVVSVVLLYIAHPLLFGAFLVWLMFFLLTSYPLLRRQFSRSKHVAKAHAKLSGGVIDTLANVLLVHSFAAHGSEHKGFKDNMGEVVKRELKSRWAGVLNKLQQGVSIVVLGAMLIIVSVHLFAQGAISAGDFVLAAITLPSLTGVAWNIGDIVVTSVRHYGNMVDAIADLQTDTERLSEGSEFLGVTNTSIAFNNITFTYPGTTQKVFDNFSLQVAPGERIGVVGSSGAGKSTLVKLLLRHYDPVQGNVRIGETSVDAVTLESLRKHIAFVPQDTTLFHRTLHENIKYARPEATDEEVLAASKHAHAHEFIEKLPEKYNTKVGERGVKLSGGERQRIAIARAMLKNAPILVLDEATSALDSESEEIVQRGLSELFKGRTVIAVAHRLSTLREMDRIVIIEGGLIVEDGNPKELLQKPDSMFKTMWEHQKGGFIA